MKTLLIAAAAIAGGAALGFFLCWTASRLNRGGHTAARRMAEAGKKKMGTMDKVLVLEGVILVAYTVAALAVFWHTGGEAVHPDRLRVRRVRPGKRGHGLDQDQQGQGGRGSQNERKRPPDRPGGAA